jgi:hypothetical protein
VSVTARKPADQRAVRLLERIRLQPTSCSSWKLAESNRTEGRFRWSAALWWAWEDLNLRLHPYQQNAGNRCANRRSRRSRPTVRGEVMCSHRVQLCALILAPTPEVQQAIQHSARAHHVVHDSLPSHRSPLAVDAANPAWASFRSAMGTPPCCRGDRTARPRSSLILWGREGPLLEPFCRRHIGRLLEGRRLGCAR